MVGANEYCEASGNPLHGAVDALQRVRWETTILVRGAKHVVGVRTSEIFIFHECMSCSSYVGEQPAIRSAAEAAADGSPQRRRRPSGARGSIDADRLESRADPRPVVKCRTNARAGRRNRPCRWASGKSLPAALRAPADAHRISAAAGCQSPKLHPILRMRSLLAGQPFDTDRDRSEIVTRRANEWRTH
jgi:hypothetical protein